MTHRYESVADLDARSERLRTSCGDGHIVWRRWGVGIPVILLHGGSGSWTHWVRTIPALAAAGFEVIAPDLPGLGDSAMPPPPLTPASSADALLAGWRNIVRDAKPVRLVGFSFGANVGVFFAAGLADQCASFTISGCAALGIPHLYVDLVKERSSMSPAERRAIHRANLANLMIADPSRIDDAAIDIQAENIRRARFRSRPFAKSDDIAVTLPQVTAPLNAIWGEKDQIAIPSVEARFTILRQSHPELDARIIPAAGHWAAYEQPEAFNSALIDLIRRRDAGAAARRS